MKKLFMLSLDREPCTPCTAFPEPAAVYAQQPAQTSELAKFAPPMIPHPIAAYIPITPEKNVCVMCHIPGEPGMKVAKGSPTPLPPSHVTGDKVNPNRYECLLCHAEVMPQK